MKISSAFTHRNKKAFYVNLSCYWECYIALITWQVIFYSFEYVFKLILSDFFKELSDDDICVKTGVNFLTEWLFPYVAWFGKI